MLSLCTLSEFSINSETFKFRKYKNSFGVAILILSSSSFRNGRWVRKEFSNNGDLEILPILLFSQIWPCVED